jgi:hypothetical protein
MIVAEAFLSPLIRICGKHTVYSYGGTWDPQASIFLNVEHHIHSSIQKSIVQSTNEYRKDRTEALDGYFPSIRNELGNMQSAACMQMANSFCLCHGPTDCFVPVGSYCYRSS